MPAEARAGSLGGIIRKARLGRSMILRELASKADLSISFLSQVERNLLTPSVSALKRIADVLDIPAGSLMFGAESRKGGVGIGLVRRGNRKRVVFPDSKIEYEMLTPDLRRRMSVLWLKAPPHAESGPVFAHDGEDAVIVLKGRLRIEIGGVWYGLGKGDSIYFSSELPHRWQNDADTVAEVVWVSTPPSF
jgi:transcriptional regulator with XRE-family HTH domain